MQTQSNFNTAWRAAASPAVDLLEDAQGITLVADLPGVSREQLKLDVHGQRLDIEAERAAWADDLQPLYTEFVAQLFKRSFVLSKELDVSDIQAELTAGVLRVRIPKAAHALPRKVSVTVN